MSSREPKQGVDIGFDGDSLRNLLRLLPGIAILFVGGIYVIGAVSISSQLTDANVSRSIALSYFSIDTILVRGLGTLTSPGGLVTFAAVIAIPSLQYRLLGSISRSRDAPAVHPTPSARLVRTRWAFLAIAGFLLLIAFLVTTPLSVVAPIAIAMAIAIGFRIVIMGSKLRRPDEDRWFASTMLGTYALALLLMAFTGPQALPSGWVSVQDDHVVCGEVLVANSEAIVVIEQRSE